MVVFQITLVLKWNLSCMIIPLVFEDRWSLKRGLFCIVNECCDIFRVVSQKVMVSAWTNLSMKSCDILKWSLNEELRQFNGVSQKQEFSHWRSPSKKSCDILKWSPKNCSHSLERFLKTCLIVFIILMFQQISNYLQLKIQ